MIHTPAHEQNIVAVVLARMDSTRLPGKPLLKISGIPIIDVVLGRLQNVRGITATVVATTHREVDRPLTEHLTKRGVHVYHGSPHDVADRLLKAALHHNAGYAIRINGDSPFLDPSLLTSEIAKLQTADYDFVTNITTRSFPYGISCEILRLKCLSESITDFDSDDREHVTRFFYRHLDTLKIRAIESDRPEFRTARLTVDTLEDLRLADQIALRLGPELLTSTYTRTAASYLDLLRETP